MIPLRASAEKRHSFHHSDFKSCKTHLLDKLSKFLVSLGHSVFHRLCLWSFWTLVQVNKNKRDKNTKRKLELIPTNKSKCVIKLHGNPEYASVKPSYLEKIFFSRCSRPYLAIPVRKLLIWNRNRHYFKSTSAPFTSQIKKWSRGKLTPGWKIAGFEGSGNLEASQRFI